MFLFFFFKQKTAYEMRISDWSSDVCSSDLENHAVRIWASVAALLVVLMASSPTVAQMTVEEARQEGRVLGNEKRQDSTLVPTDSARAEAVPGYGGTSLPQGAYFDNPERMEAEATASKSSNEQYRITTDADRTRPTFSN